MTVGEILTAVFACTDTDDDGADTSATTTCAAEVSPQPAGNNSSPIVSGDPLETATPGSFTLTVTATDAGGLTDTVSASYTVLESSPNASPDETPPAISVQTPHTLPEREPYAFLREGLVYVADYECLDEEGGSGVATCAGPVADGEPIDTSTPGVYTFTVESSDNVGNRSISSIPYRVLARMPEVSGRVTDEAGVPLPGSTIEFWPVDDPTDVTSLLVNEAGTFQFTAPSWQIDESQPGGDVPWLTYDLRVTGPAGSDLGARWYGVTLEEGRFFDIPLNTATAHVTGTVSDGAGLPGGRWSLRLDGSSSIALDSQWHADRWRRDVEPGWYRAHLTGTAWTNGSGFSYDAVFTPRLASGDVHLDLAPFVRPVLVHLQDADGNPTNASVDLTCLELRPAGQSDVVVQTTTAGGNLDGGLTLWGTPTRPGSTCTLVVAPTSGPRFMRSITIDPNAGNEFTIRIPEVVLSSPDRSFPAVPFPEVIDAEERVVNVAWPALVETGTYSVGFTVDEGDFVASARTAGTEYLASEELDLEPVVRPVTVRLETTDGDPASGRLELRCGPFQPAGQSWIASQTTTSYGSGVGEIILKGTPTPPGESCGLVVRRDDGPDYSQRITIDQTGDTLLTLQRQPTIRISGTVVGGDASFPDDWHDYTAIRPLDADGVSLDVTVQRAFRDGVLHWSFDAVPGEYHVAVRVNNHDGVPVYTSRTPLRRYEVDTGGLVIEPVVARVSVSVLAVETPAPTGAVYIDCMDVVTGLAAPDRQYTRDSAEGVLDGLTVRSSPTSPTSPCTLRVSVLSPLYPNGNHYEEVTVTANGPNEIYLNIAPTGELTRIDPRVSSDPDGVPDIVEMRAPNEGDGNSDGTPDADQANVTSLPGAVSPEGAPGPPYVTIAAPQGTTLTGVRTLDPTDAGQVAAPPPAGMTMTQGLVSFTVTDISEGSDQTIRIFGDTTGVNGYAKYQPATNDWRLLPADRVEIGDGWVEITLSDGGIGDADGEVNGAIDDPGGMVRLADMTPPVVTGIPTSGPNRNGWYRDDVTVNWTALDPSPSAGGVSTPEPTTITGEGADRVATSAEVCDARGNCGQGAVTGLHIDRTAPTITISGVDDGAIYTLGAGPTPACSAVDALSGLDGSCEGTTTGGNANGVGAFTYVATATDLAGNTTTARVAFSVVYRFDGFLQPINDPGLAPATSASVFKTGSTIPVKFRLTDARGREVAPLAAPEWVGPEFAASASPPANEPTLTGVPTQGTAFLWANDHWQYNWKTTGTPAGNLYRIGARLDDGTTHWVVVGLR